MLYHVQYVLLYELKIKGNLTCIFLFSQHSLVVKWWSGISDQKRRRVGGGERGGKTPDSLHTS